LRKRERIFSAKQCCEPRKGKGKRTVTPVFWNDHCKKKDGFLGKMRGKKAHLRQKELRSIESRGEGGNPPGAGKKNPQWGGKKKEKDLLSRRCVFRAVF